MDKHTIEGLRAGKLAPEDLMALEDVVERTEAATRQLRGGMVE